MNESGLRCPYCGHGSSSVKDTVHHGNITRRRRDCDRCGLRFYTVEQVAIELLDKESTS